MQPNALEAWRKTPAGDYLFSKERAYFQREVANVFGFCALQFGFLADNFLQNNRIRCHMFAEQTPHPKADFCAHPDALPLACDSVDLLVFPHTLDFYNNASAMIGEAARVLKDEGRLILTGFNPLSLWGFFQKWQQRRTPIKPPWHAHFHSMFTVQQLLREHHLQLISGRFMAYAPPCLSAAMFARCQALEDAGDRWWPHAAAVYALTAIKRRVHGIALPVNFAAPKNLASGGQYLI